MLDSPSSAQRGIRIIKRSYRTSTFADLSENPYGFWIGFKMQDAEFIGDSAQNAKR